MATYIIFNSEEDAKAISRGFYRLSRPESQPETASDITKYSVMWIAHPSDGRWALVFDNYDLYRHPQIVTDIADPEDTNGVKALMASLLPLIMSTQQQKDDFATYVAANDRLYDSDVFPLCDADKVKDQATMEAEGWFPEEE